jgi:predicted DNA-binding protein
MIGITIKLPDATLRRLREEARRTGRTVAAIVRERVESQEGEATSVYALTSDLAGCLPGSSRAATNARRKFRRS